MKTMVKFLTRLYGFLKKRIFANETILLFQHNAFIDNSSPAIIQYATHENINDVLTFNKPHYIPVFHDFLNNGDKGYFGYLKNKCVYRSWIKIGPQEVYPHWAAPMELCANEIFIHYCETAPEARGKNIYTTALSKITQEFKDKTILISTNIKNKASIRGIEKAGFVEIKKIKAVIVLGVKIVKYTTSFK